MNKVVGILVVLLKHGTSFLRLIIPCLICGFAFRASAVENHWTGVGGDNLWSNPANWSLGRVPLTSDTVIIDLSGTYSVILDTNAEVLSFALGGGNGAQMLTLTNNALHYAQGSVLTNGILNLDGGMLSGSNLTVTGTMNWSAGTLSGPGVTTISNGGTLNGIAPWEKTLDNQTLENQGTIVWDASYGALDGVNGLIYNRGLFILRSEFVF